MNHLVPIGDLNRIENTLLSRRNELTQATASMFNIIMLVLVLSGFAFFLYVQYNQTQEAPEEKRIPFEPTVWYSATRNVRAEEYGRQLQPFEIETRHGVPGAPLGAGGTGIW
jgi:hypothetical protein